jgi:hypothetical protein
MNDKSMIPWRNPRKKQLLRSFTFCKFSIFDDPIIDIRTPENSAKHRSKHKVETASF